MSLQFISDGSGRTTGVFIPIEEWNKIQAELGNSELLKIIVPEWQIKQAEKEQQAHMADPSSSVDFYEAIDRIERDLDV